MIDRIFRYRWRITRHLTYRGERSLWPIDYEIARFRTKRFARRFLREHAVFRYDLRLERLP
jgi:hypothetical protein